MGKLPLKKLYALTSPIPEMIPLKTKRMSIKLLLNKLYKGNWVR